jgi:uncharacterized delta-60 repeat protein
VAVAPDGKIVIAGTVYYNNTSDFGVARLNADFTPDTTFGAGGTTFVDFDGNRDDDTYAVAVQADRKIVVGGGGYNDTGYVGAVVRLNEDGTLDDTFDGNGKKAVNSIFKFTDVAIQDDGKIVMAGEDQDVGDGDFGVVRLNPNGSPDGSFDGDGLLFTGFGDGVQAVAIGIDPDGRIVVAGSHFGGTGVHVARYLPANGMLDASFDGDGRMTDTFSSVPDDMAVQQDGRIVVFGKVIAGAPFSGPSFGVNGVAFADFNAVEVATGLTVRGDGTIAVGGYTTGPSGTEFAVAQFTPDGQPDLAFSGDGRATVRVGSATENVAHAVTFFRGDRIVLGGYATILGSRQFALAAFETTRDVTVPTTTTSTSTTLAPGETTSTTTEATGPTSTTVQPIPGLQETCGNCADDDGNGLVDFEDPACCPAGAATMTLTKLGIGAGRKGTTLAFAARLAESGVAAGPTVTQDVVLQVAANGERLLCARVPAANLTRRKSRLKFRDAAHAVVSAGGLERLRLRARKDGSGAVAAGGRRMPFAVPAAGAAVVTLGLRDPAQPEGGNRCARAQATLEASRKGALRLPR